MRVIAFVAALLASVCGGAEAATVSQMQTWTTGPGSEENRLTYRSFDPFDPTLGVLSSVSLAVSGRASYFGQILAIGDGPGQQVSGRIADLVFARTPVMSVTGVVGSPELSCTAGRYTPHCYVGLTGLSLAIAADGMSGAGLSYYTAGTSVTVALGFARLLSGQLTDTYSSGLASSVDVTLSYEYDPFVAAVPLPASLALMLAGLGGLGLIRLLHGRRQSAGVSASA